jgi:hypothetical protein
VKPLVRKTLEEKHGGPAGDKRRPLLLRVADAQDRVVRRNRGVNDLADAELEVIPDQVLLGARQSRRHVPHVRRGDHKNSKQERASADSPENVTLEAT